MGAWIEIFLASDCKNRRKSHPTWVRGLKLTKALLSLLKLMVAPHMGAWIEIILKILVESKVMSHPTWVRGLKLC